MSRRHSAPLGEVSVEILRRCGAPIGESISTSTSVSWHYLQTKSVHSVYPQSGPIHSQHSNTSKQNWSLHMSAEGAGGGIVKGSSGSGSLGPPLAPAALVPEVALAPACAPLTPAFDPLAPELPLEPPAPALEALAPAIVLAAAAPPDPACAPAPDETAPARPAAAALAPAPLVLTTAPVAPP